MDSLCAHVCVCNREKEKENMREAGRLKLYIKGGFTRENLRQNRSDDEKQNKERDVVVDKLNNSTFSLCSSEQRTHNSTHRAIVP